MTSNNEQAIQRVVLATGVSSVVTQLLTIRESLTLFQGNEIVIALILFNWLVLGGLGTLTARLASSGRIRVTVERLGWMSLLLGALPAVQLLAMRMLRDVVFIRGVSVGFYPTLAFTFLVIAPYCLLLGFVLPYSLNTLRLTVPRYPGARIYIIDNLGDVSGGVLFSFLLVYLVTPLQAAALASALLLAAALRLFEPRRRFRPTIVTAALAAAAVLGAGLVLETDTLQQPEGQTVFYRESPYGRILVREDQGQYTLFEDGVPVFSSQNRIRAEEAVHYPMSQLERPNRVLVISTEGGIMRELAKYDLEQIDYIELNPVVTEALLRFDLIRRVPKLAIRHGDARAYLAAAPHLYDAILVNLPEPETFQTNRFFTERFFELARSRLSAGGVLGFSVAGFDNYLAEPQRRKVSSLYQTAGRHFSQILMLPGQKIHFICRNLPVDANIPARLNAKSIETVYIQGFFYGNVSEFRIRQLEDLVDDGAPVNRDLRPELMRMMFAQWFAKYATSPAAFLGILLVGMLVYLVRVKLEEFVLFSTGWLTMGSEILVIFAFQIFFGYIYLQIGIIITIFLAGLLPGAYLGQRMARRQMTLLVWTDGVLIVLLAVFAGVLMLAGDGIPKGFFLGFGFAVSLACGFQFPIALGLQRDDAQSATRFFSADLIGAAFGTLITSLMLIPYLGIYWTVVSLIGLKLVSLLAVGINHVRIK